MNDTTTKPGVQFVGQSSDHMNFAASESAALEPCAWERWYDAAEKMLGHDLDGDDSEEARAAGTADGYSVDGAYDAWRAGITVAQYTKQVAERKAALASAGGAA